MAVNNAVLALLGAGGFLLLRGKTGAGGGAQGVIPPTTSGAGVTPAGGAGAGATGLAVAGGVLQVAVPIAVKAATGGAATGTTAQTAAAPEEVAIGTMAGSSVGAFAVIAVWVVALIVALISAAAIAGAKWIQQRLQELNGRALPNMYECEFALLKRMLGGGGYTYEVSDVRDARFDWQDRSVATGQGGIVVVGYRKILRNVKYAGVPVDPVKLKYLLILARLLSYEYAYWLCVYGMNMWNSWGDPTGKNHQPNYAEAPYFDEIWGVPLANGQVNDAVYESATAAFEAVRKPGLLPFAQMKIGMQAQAIMYAANVAGGQGGQRGAFLQGVMGLKGAPGIIFGDTTITFAAPTWGQYAFTYDFANNKLNTTAPLP